MPRAGTNLDGPLVRPLSQRWTHTSKPRWTTAFVIFANARDQWFAIYKRIAESQAVEVLHVRECEFRNHRQLRHVLYGNDYAPLWHLQGKLRYLREYGLRTLVVFVRENSTELEMVGEGAFVHVRSRSTASLKAAIREEFNYSSSPDAHVVHSTDNPSQALDIARFLGIEGVYVSDFRSHGPGGLLPWHVNSEMSSEIRELPIGDLKIKLCFGDIEELREIENTPHFISLQSSNPVAYESYLEMGLGKWMTDGHNWKRFLRVADSISRLDLMAPIVVKELSRGDYVVLDGSHRVAAMKHSGIAATQALIVGSNPC